MPVRLLIVGDAQTANCFGETGAGADDINGDSYPEILLRRVCPGDSNVVSVFSGLDTALLHSFVSGEEHDDFGASLAGSGDLDGDGVPDLLVGAPGPQSLFQPGTVYEYSGASGALIRVLDGNVLTGSATARFGASLVRNEDLDDDGVDDFLVGAPSAVRYSVIPEGAVLAISGSSGLPIYSVWGRAGAFFGRSLAVIGDVDADGVSDFVVGSPDYRDSTSAEVGMATVVSGRAGLILRELTGEPYSRFGQSVSAAGDFDKDGTSDFIVGSPQSSYGSSAAGKVSIFSGGSGEPLFSIHGTGAAQALGTSVTSCDVNGDGEADFIVGSPGADGDGYLACGKAGAYSGADGSLIFEVLGSGDYATLGMLVASSGDINGDGREDVLVGQSNPPAAMIYGLANIVPARVVSSTGHLDLQLLGSSSRIQFRLEPDASIFTIDDVVLPSVVALSTNPSFVEVRVASGTECPSSGGSQTSFCISREVLRSYWLVTSSVQNTTVLVFEGNLRDGRRFRAPFWRTIVPGAPRVALVTPNPVRQSGTVSFLTRTRGDVRLRLFDVLGRKTGSEWQGYALPPGYQSIPLGGPGSIANGLPSGVFYYQVDTPDGPIAGRFTLVR